MMFPGIFLALVTAVIVLVLGSLFLNSQWEDAEARLRGQRSENQLLRREAVLRGFARWAVDDDGNTQFVWLPGKDEQT